MGSAKEPYERLDVRSRWKHEALDFTPWLACNLNLVGEVIGKNLEFKSREIAVCPHLFLDILAKDTDTAKLVAIENQLEWTDIDHLGRLIVYSTLLNARIVIWIATEFTYELAEVLNRLNEWTSNEIEFYGLKIECVRNTADSDSEPRFKKVVSPGGWDRENTLPIDSPVPPPIQRYIDFFEPLIDRLRDSNFAAVRPIRMFDHTGRYFPSIENDGIWYAASLEGKNDAWVTAHIRCEDNEMTKNLFDKLEANKDQIESSLIAYPEPEWRWLRHDRYSFSSINIRKDGSIDDPEDKLEETRTWMLDLLPKLKEVFDPRIAALLADRKKCVR